VQQQASYREVFAAPEFGAMWTAQALSLLGNQFAEVAIAVLVYSRTGSAFLAALAYALTYLPPIAGGPLLAAIADLFPRRRVMIWCDLLRAGLVAVMALPGVPIWAVCVLVAVTTLAGVPFTAGRSALLPEVLPGDKLPAGTAIGLVTDQASQVIGFVTGAVVVATAGARVTLALDAVTFLFSAALVARWVRYRPAPHWTAEGGRSPWAGARLGISLVARDRYARLLVLLGWLAGLYVMPEGLAAPYAHALHQGPAAVGLLMAAIPAGTVLGAVILTRLVGPSRRLRVIGWLAILATAPLIGSAFRPPLPVVLVLWAVTGFGSGYQAAAAAAFVRRMPDSGRAAAIGVAGSGLLAAQGLGFLAGGAAAGAIGPQAAVAWAGTAGLALAIPLSIAWRASVGHLPESATAVPPRAAEDAAASSS
jgi:MFS family permease